MGLLKTLKKEREENRRKNPENKPTQFQATMRLVCGGYLWYLIYEIIRDGGLKENTGWLLVLMIVGLIAFLATGGYCIYDGIRMFMKKDFYDPNAPVPAESEETEETADDTDEAGSADSPEK